MTALLALAAAVLPTPLSAAERADFRCAAILAIVADAQARGDWRDRESAAATGRRYLGIVGDAASVMPGRDPAMVAQWLVSAATVVRREGVSRAAYDRCWEQARRVIAADAAAARP